MARGARIAVRLIERGDTIEMHFEDERFPPVYFNERERPVAHRKLRALLDEIEIVEEIQDQLAC